MVAHADFQACRMPANDEGASPPCKMPKHKRCSKVQKATRALKKIYLEQEKGEDVTDALVKVHRT